MYDLILKNISRYISLTKEEEEYFISLLKPKKLRKRQYLLQAGDICRFESYVNKGCLRQYVVDDAGKEHLLSFAIEDWWISDFDSLLNNKPALTFIEAVEESEILMIENKSFEEMLNHSPKFERHFRIMLQRAYVAHQRRIIENISLPAEDRYRLFTQRYPDIEQRLPLKQIASYLGITPESLSRIRSQRIKQTRKA